MFGNLIALFKARKDPELAKSIASELVIDGVVERLSLPLVIAKFWMSLALVGLSVLTGLFIWAGAAAHWSLSIPALLFAGLIYAIIRIWRGLNRGSERITAFAKAELKTRAAAIRIPAKQPAEDPHPEN